MAQETRETRETRKKDTPPGVKSTTAKVAFFMSLVSAIGWIIFYVIVLFLISEGEEGTRAHQFVHPAAAGFIGSGLPGSWLIKRGGTATTGGCVIFAGYVATTCAIVVLAFPLFIPWDGFEWYVYVMLALLFTGVIGGSLVIR